MTNRRTFLAALGAAAIAVVSTSKDVFASPEPIECVKISRRSIAYILQRNVPRHLGILSSLQAFNVGTIGVHRYKRSLDGDQSVSADFIGSSHFAPLKGSHGSICQDDYHANELNYWFPFRKFWESVLFLIVGFAIGCSGWTGFRWGRIDPMVGLLLTALGLALMVLGISVLLIWAGDGIANQPLNFAQASDYLPGKECQVYYCPEKPISMGTVTFPPYAVAVVPRKTIHWSHAA